MKIVLAPCAYKGSYSSVQLAAAMATAAHEVLPDAEIVRVPIADGGDGTLDCIEACVACDAHMDDVMGPTGQPTEARWLRLMPTQQSPAAAVVELAQASGIALLEDAVTPFDAHTIGCGELLMSALRAGAEIVTLTVGGSASTDGGAGLLSAMGARLYDANGATVVPGARGLCDIARVDLSGLPADLHRRLRVATDVDNPLLGPSGAAAVYGPQKGAKDDDIALLEKGLRHFADVLEQHTGRRLRDTPGAGAAGGVAFGLACATGCPMIPGFDWLSQLIQLEQTIAGADLVISAEGRLDEQSLQGKAIGGLASLCRLYGIPLAIIPARAQTSVSWASFGIKTVCEAASDDGLATLADVVYCTHLILRDLPGVAPVVHR